MRERLPADQMAAIGRMVDNGYSNREIAEACELPVRIVRSVTWIQRASIKRRLASAAQNAINQS
jgi:hypothetical protein